MLSNRPGLGFGRGRGRMTLFWPNGSILAGIWPFWEFGSSGNLAGPGFSRDFKDDFLNLHKWYKTILKKSSDFRDYNLNLKYTIDARKNRGQNPCAGIPAEAGSRSITECACYPRYPDMKISIFSLRMSDLQRLVRLENKELFFRNNKCGVKDEQGKYYSIPNERFEDYVLLQIPVHLMCNSFDCKWNECCK